MTDVKQHILEIMAEAVSRAVAGFDEDTGRFLSEPTGPPAPGAGPEDIGWTVINQDIIYPLAVLYATPGTRFHGDRATLNMALRGGDAIRNFQYPDGQVEFLKVDGSRWGRSYMCWTNYAWLEAYVLLKDSMDETRRKRWEEGLTLSHDGQMREISDFHVHNIPCWKAMSCYRAGKVFGRADWSEAGTALIEAAIAEQQPGGYWAEHGGPTTLYNHVYVHALGLYYKFSGNERVLPVLEAAAEFHQTFIYPSGAPVETIDGRVKYHNRIMVMGWVGFSSCATGRRLVRHLATQLDSGRDFHSFQGGAVASSAQHLISGEEGSINLDRVSFRETYRNWAVVHREGPWFACMSAFTTAPVATRWGQDRQAFLSLWHDDFGLILGGGNSKDQAEWSTFVADGRFVPEKGEILPEGDGVALTYGNIRCSLRLRVEGAKVVMEIAAEEGPALQQFMVRVKAGDTLHTEAGSEVVLDAVIPVEWSSTRIGRWLEVGGCRIAVPSGTAFRWPIREFNPYAADGAGPFGSESGVISVRLDGEPVVWEVEMRDARLRQ